MHSLMGKNFLRNGPAFLHHQRYPFCLQHLSNAKLLFPFHVNNRSTKAPDLNSFTSSYHVQIKQPFSLLVVE